MSKISMHEILRKSNESAVELFHTYYEMSQGEWIKHTPEYWYTVGIAKKLSERGLIATLETKIKDIGDYASKKRPGPPGKDIREDGRADMVVWWKSSLTPRAIIEVKRAWNSLKADSLNDIKRICDVLSSYGTGKASGKMEFGIFTIVTDTKDKGKDETKKLLESVFSNFYEQVENVLLEKSKDRAVDFYIQDTAFNCSEYVKEEGKMAACSFLIRVW